MLVFVNYWIEKCTVKHWNNGLDVCSLPCNSQITPIHLNMLFWEFTYPLSWNHLMPLNRASVWSIAQLYTQRSYQQTSRSYKSCIVCESQLSYMVPLCSCLPRVLSLSGIEHAARELLTLLGGFAKLRKATTISVISVYMSIPMEQLCSHRTDFHAILNSSVFRISVKKIQTIKIWLRINNGEFR